MSYSRIVRNTYHVPHILQLHAEIGGMFADQMDLLTLTKWRMTCKANYNQTSAALRRTLTSLLRPFVPSPSNLLDIVTRFHAIFGGEYALSFILRDPEYKPDVLEIYTSEHEFSKLCDAILDDRHIRNLVVDHNFTSSTLFFALRRLIAQTLTIHLFNKKIIYVHRSYTASAAAPLTRAPCTALSNFVTAYSFGCSHPLLTIRRQALLADQEIPYLPTIDATTLNNLLKHQFTMAVSPAAWPEFRRTVPPKDGATAQSIASHAAMSTGTFVAADEETLTHGSVITDTEFALSIDLAHLYGDVTDDSVEADDEPQPLAPTPNNDPPVVEPPIVGHHTLRVTFPIGATEEQPHIDDVTTNVMASPSGKENVEPPNIDHDTLRVALPAGAIREQSRVSNVTTDVPAGPVGEEYGSPECAVHHVALPMGADGVQSRVGNVTTDVPAGPVGEEYGSPDCAVHHVALPMGGDGEQSRVGDATTDVPAGPVGEEYGSPDCAVHHVALPMGGDGEQSRVGDATTDVLAGPAGESYVDACSSDCATPPAAPPVGTNVEQSHFDNVTADVIGGVHGEEAVDDGYNPTPNLSTSDDIVIQCWRDRYICPSQGRYFGDKGSFIGFLDPLRGDEIHCVDNNIAPYGPMVVWRIMSTFDCEEGCEYFDDVLEEGVTSIPVLFKKDPYGELRDIVSDRRMSEYGRQRMLSRQRSRSM